MAIYHFAAQVISRSNGRSSTGAAAYRAGERIHDERTGITFDYSRKSGVAHSEIMAPANAPEWVTNRAKLWNTVEQIEKRKDSQVCREIEVALPIELTNDQQNELIRNFVQKNFVNHGMIADIAIHRPKQENPHCHILLTMRDIGPEGFGPKNRVWNDKQLLEKWRGQWSKAVNRSLENAGHTVRIDHRTIAEQGIDRIPQIHIGPKIPEMENRGIHTERGTKILDIEQKNELIKTFQSELEAIQHECNHENPPSPQSRTNSGRNRAADPELGNAGRPSPKQHQGNGKSQQSASVGMERPAEKRGQGSGDRSRGSHQTHASPAQGHTEPASDHRDLAQSPEPPALENAGLGELCEHYRSNAIDRIVALAGPSTPSASTGEPRPEDRSRTTQTRTAGSAQTPLDRSYLAAQRQLDAMGATSFEIGIRDRQGRMMQRTWTKAETLAAMPWLKRENAKGADVYVRPASQDGQNAGIVLVDDLNRSALAQMQADGLNPASVTETSPGNFQAWVRVYDQPISAETATLVAVELARRYGGDPNSADWRHFGRLAGLTNQKPIHRDHAGRAPYVLAHESNGKQTREGTLLLARLFHQLADQQQKVESENRLERVKNAPESPQTGRDIPDPTLTFQQGLKRLLGRFGENLDLSRADYMVGVDMAKAGYSPQNIAQAIANASPELATRKASHQRDYIERTVRAVYRHPEVAMALEQQRERTATRPQRQRGSEADTDLER